MARRSLAAMIFSPAPSSLGLGLGLTPLARV
jgi:hypothetical protein